jgi:hypothetical protein
MGLQVVPAGESSLMSNLPVQKYQTCQPCLAKIVEG